MLLIWDAMLSHNVNWKYKASLDIYKKNILG